MNLIFSRKGFDSAAGGGPSPILGGRAISLPIPEGSPDGPTYVELGLGFVEELSRGRVRAADTAHTDPMEVDGRIYFGQAGAAQSHLSTQGVGPRDLFLFFGLFRDREAARGHPDAHPHHRIFGWMRVEEMLHLGLNLAPGSAPGVPVHHPHLRRGYHANSTIYVGPGRLGAPATDRLRLSAEGAGLSIWRVPVWLRELGLTYHRRPDRWGEERLATVGRGQEFVCHLPDDAAHPAHAWSRQIIAEVGR